MPENITGHPASVPVKARRGFAKVGIRLTLALLLLTATALGIRHWLLSRGWESTDDAFIAAHVQQVSSRIAARVEKVLVQDNQMIHAGDVLVELDKRDLEVALRQAEAKLASERANVAKAEAQVAAAEAGASQVAAQLESKQVEAENAETELQRNQDLRKTGAVSEREFDKSRTEAQSNRSTAKATAKQVETVKAGIIAMRANLDATKASVAEAELGVERAKLDLSYSRIVATQDGRVTARSVEPGNYVQPGQGLMAIVSPQVWIQANYKETQLAHMRPGQSATVRVDAFPKMELKGHVDSIQAGSGAQFSLLPPENATGNFVKVVQRVPVKIVLDLSGTDGPPLGPGMSAVPRVRTRD